jgi:predicted nucleic acid-binding Zn ribbon protein
MAKISSVLSKMFGKENIYAAKKNKSIFDSWDYILEKTFLTMNGAENHSRVVNFSNGILTIEADHTGWIQIIQTEKNKILGIINQNFQELRVEEIEVGLAKFKT